MSDFVAEIRPKTTFRVLDEPAKGDPLSENRPRSINSTEMSQIDSGRLPINDSDIYLQKMLLDKQFSKEGIIRLLEGSIVTLIEKILTGSTVFSIQGSLNISVSNYEHPVVVDVNRHFTSPPKTSCLTQQLLDSSLNIKIKHMNVPSLHRPAHLPDNSCSPTSDYSKDPCLSPTRSDISQHAEWFHFDRDDTMSTPTHRSESSSPLNAHSPTYCTSPLNANSPTYCTSPSSFTCSSRNERALSSPSEDSNTSVAESVAKSISSPTYVFPVLKTTSDLSCDRVDSVDEIDDVDTVTIPFCNITTDDVEHRADVCCRVPHEEGSDEIDDVDDDTEFGYNLVIDESPTDEMKASNDVDDFNRSEVKFGRNINNTKQQIELMDSGGLAGATNLADKTYDEGFGENEEHTSAVDLDKKEMDTSEDLLGNNEINLSIKSPTTDLQSSTCRSQHELQNTKCISTPLSAHVQCLTYPTRRPDTIRSNTENLTPQRPSKKPHCTQISVQQEDPKDHTAHHALEKLSQCSIEEKDYTGLQCVDSSKIREHSTGLPQVRSPPHADSFQVKEANTAHKRSHEEQAHPSSSTCSRPKHALVHSAKHYTDPITTNLKNRKNKTDVNEYPGQISNNQYIHYEHSQTQEKTHKYKKTQFRNEHPPQRHLSIPDYTTEDAGRTLTDEKPSDVTFTNKDHSMSYHFRCDEVSSSTLCDSVARGSHWCDIASRHSVDDASQTTPSRFEQDNNDSEGQLLDLSMKKVSNPLSDVASYDLNRATHGGIFEGTTDQTFNNSLRNDGVNVASVNFMQEHRVKVHRSSTGQSAYLNEGMINEDQMLGVSANPQLSSEQRYQTAPVMCRQPSVENVEVPVQRTSRNKDCTAPNLILSNQTKTVESGRTICPEARAEQKVKWLNNLRYKPYRFGTYGREKMVDLAAKFLVARGNSFVSYRDLVKASAAGSHENVSSEARGDDDRRKSGHLMTPHTQEVSCPSQAEKGRLNIRHPLKENFEVIRDNMNAIRDNMVIRDKTNSGTTLGCHIPTFVTSDNTDEDIELPESPVNSPLQTCNSDEVYIQVETGSTRCHRCETCKEVFDSFNDLESHSAEVHKRYLCRHCWKSFTARPNRDRHMRYHTGERPYKCDLCDQAFYRGDDLKYHRTTRHPSAQPFVCSRCSARFTWARDLERHTRQSKCTVLA